MTRLARYTRDPMTNITTRVLIRVGREPARQAPELRLVSECIPGPALRARERGVGRITEPYRHPCHSSQQQNALREESRTPLFPPGQTVRILKRNASTRPESTAHQPPGFMGLRLSLRGQVVGPITPLRLVQGATVALAVQDRTQITAPVAVTTSDRPAHAHIGADPVVHFPFFRYGNFDPDPAIPLAVFTEDFALFAERSAGVGQRPGAWTWAASINSALRVPGSCPALRVRLQSVKARRYARPANSPMPLVEGHRDSSRSAVVHAA
jgi:hypothetical protein